MTSQENQAAYARRMHKVIDKPLPTREEVLAKYRQYEPPISASALPPKYTVNTTLDWQATDKLSFQVSGTYYGKQEAPTLNSRSASSYERSAQQDVDPYGLMGLSSGYEFSKNLSVRVGINNLLDKRLSRKGNADDAGAQTYNEPGRAYFASVTTSF